MSVIYILLPVASLLAAGGVAAFIWAVRRGQFDDLDTPAVRMLHDDEDEDNLHQRRQLPARAAQRIMLQFAGPDPLLHQILRPAAVRHILGVVAIQRDAKASDAVSQRLAMLAGRDGHAGHPPHVVDQRAMDPVFSFALDGKAREIP